MRDPAKELIEMQEPSMDGEGGARPLELSIIVPTSTSVKKSCRCLNGYGPR